MLCFIVWIWFSRVTNECFHQQWQGWQYRVHALVEALESHYKSELLEILEPETVDCSTSKCISFQNKNIVHFSPFLSMFVLVWRKEKVNLLQRTTAFINLEYVYIFAQIFSECCRLFWFCLHYSTNMYFLLEAVLFVAFVLSQFNYIYNYIYIYIYLHIMFL